MTCWFSTGHASSRDMNLQVRVHHTWTLEHIYKPYKNEMILTKTNKLTKTKFIEINSKQNTGSTNWFTWRSNVLKLANQHNCFSWFVSLQSDFNAMTEPVALQKQGTTSKAELNATIIVLYALKWKTPQEKTAKRRLLWLRCSHMWELLFWLKYTKDNFQPALDN